MSDYFASVAACWDEDSLKVERATITAQQLKLFDFHCYASCIDFGCGTGLLAMQLTDTFATVHLADSSSAMLSVAQRKLRDFNINNVEIHHVHQLGAIDGQHSAIVTLMTLHHLDDIDAFFSAAYHCLAPQGCLVVADLYSEDGSFHKHNPAFRGHHGFDVKALSDIAERNGFNVQKVARYYEMWQENGEGQQTCYPLFMLIAKKI